MKATKVRDLPTSDTGAVQALYRLDPPYDVYSWRDEQMEVAEYVVASAVVVPYSGPETYLFRADADGEVVDWSELPGSYRGGLNHQKAIDGLIESAS